MLTFISIVTLSSTTEVNYLPLFPLPPVKKYNRKSMMLSDLCVVSVSLPASIAQGQKGIGAMLKFRFSPYKQIEFLRVAILKVCTNMIVYACVCVCVCVHVCV